MIKIAHLVEGIQQVGKQDNVQLRGQVELFPEGLQDRPEQVGGVEDGHGHEQEVEGVSHLFPVRQKSRNL